MRKLASLCFVLTLLCLTISADTSTAISVTGAAVTQDFNSLTPPGTTPAGWGFVETGTNANTAFTAGTGSANAGDTYSFGAAGSSDRAFGGLQSGTLVPTIGARFVNNTGGTITSLSISYAGEQWRLGTSGRTDRLDFQISTNASDLVTGTYTDVNALDFNAPVSTGTVGALDGNVNRVIVSSTINGLNIPSGAGFFIRWVSFDASGADDGLAIDDFSLSAGDPAPTASAPLTGASNVPVDSAITINFSESVTASAAAFSLSCGGGSPGFTASASPSASFTLTPDSNLPFNAHCTVIVAAVEISDTDPNDPPDHMAADFTFSFDTAGAVDVAPAVTTTSPADGAIDVNPTANIVVNFSEQVTASTSAFAIQCGSAVLFGQTSGASASFVLDPNLALPSGTLCTVTVTGNEISDVDANDPPDHPADRSFSFTTATPPPTNVVINEIDADTPGSGTDVAEFVELYDGGVGTTHLDGLTILFYNGSNHLSYYAVDLDHFSTNASGYFIIANPGVPGVDITFDPGPSGFLQNGADAVALVAGNATSFPNGTPLSTANVIDAVVYDTDDDDDPGLLALLNAGQPQVNENAGGDGPNQSSGRCDNGTGGLRNTSTYRPGAPSPGGANNCPVPSNSPVVISQIYGGGGNTGATYLNDYVELYNRSGAAVDVTGWSVQYVAATGSGWGSNRTPLGGSIGAHEYYLVKLGSGGDTGLPLPNANVAGPINMSASSGKIALVDVFDSLLGDCPTSNPHLMDFVGYGSSTCGEGNTTAATLSASTADFRINDGATDTDRNLQDFVSGMPNPRRTAPIVELGPFLVGSDPGINGINVPRDPTLVFTFSEPVTVAAHWFDLTCATTGVHDSYSLSSSGNFVDVTLNVDLLGGELCTITVLKDQVHDQDADDSAPGTDTLPGNYSWSFTVASGAPAPYPPSVHLTFGNPTNADLSQPLNYLMEKAAYALSYNRDLGRPNWVSWHLSPEWYGTLARVDTFRADPRVPDDPDWYRVQGFDFSGSGFDRGHMVPNADRDNQNRIPVNQATYLMTNMVAQAPGNNQGPWAALEGALRVLADAGNDLFIVAGPHGEGGYGSSVPRALTNKIANGKVSVPAETWKAVIVWPRPTGANPREAVSCATRTIAVIMPNDDAVVRTDDGKLKTNWEDYLTSIDAVESLTGYDLFADLPDAVEYCVEAGVNGHNPEADIAPPVIQCGVADGSWHGNNVTIACTASDAESGLSDASDASFTLMTSVVTGDQNANAYTDTRVVCDVVGNCVTAGPISGNMIDRKLPTTSVTTPVNGAVYQQSHTVIAAFACADDGSDIATCVGSAANGASIDTSSTGAKSFVVTATDLAGNTSSTTVNYTVATNTISINNIPSPAQIGDGFVAGFDYAGDGATSVTSITPSTCVASGTVVTFLKLGTCTLVAHAAGTATFDPATGPAQSFEIVKRVTTISIANIPANAMSGGSFTPVFDYAGNGQTHLRSETPSVCKIHGDSGVRFVGAGTCTVSAWATPSGTYQPADGPPQSFLVQ